jgi:hypothetical protein
MESIFVRELVNARFSQEFGSLEGQRRKGWGVELETQIVVRKLERTNSKGITETRPEPRHCFENLKCKVWTLRLTGDHIDSE